MYGLELTTAPTAEPLSLNEAKLHCRVEPEVTDEDDLIRSHVITARDYCESYTGRALVTQTWKLTLDELPPDEIGMPKAPLQSVSSFAYVATDGTSTTLSSSLYQVDAKSEPGRIRPAYGQIWPSTRAQMAAITITFVCGYGAASAVPDGIKQAMKLLIGHWYANREAVGQNPGGPLEMAVKALLDRFWVGVYAHDFACR